MRTSSAIRVLAALCLFVVAIVETASACQCGGGSHSNNNWENAKQEAQISTAIFEGTPVRFDLRWKLLTAKDGDLIPADMYSDATNLPGMVITFRVQRVYKGTLGSEVELHTGIGGGDCAAIFASGLNYLVFTSRDKLGVTMCSPGGWVGQEKVETELRYLRNEHPIAQDLEPTERWWTKPNATQIQERREQAAAERHKRYHAATGRICGTVIRPPHSDDELHGTVEFLSTQGSYPLGQSTSSINADGSFCSPDLGPGRYHLHFVGGSKDGLAVALYYPGVSDVEKASVIEVAAGQTVSNVAFKIEAQSLHSVRGVVAFDDFHSNADDVTIFLIRTDGDRRVWYSEKAKSVLPRLAYFKFDSVLPGNYAACALTSTSGWMTKKADLTVTNHMKFLYLELLRKK